MIKPQCHIFFNRVPHHHPHLLETLLLRSQILLLHTSLSLLHFCAAQVVPLHCLSNNRPRYPCTFHLLIFFISIDNKCTLISILMQKTLSFCCFTRQENITDLLCLDLFFLINQLGVELNKYQFVEASCSKPISLLSVYL